MELVFGRQEKLEALTLNHGDDVEELTRQVKEKAKELDDGDGGLVLVDLLGGSPCNVTASPPRLHLQSLHILSRKVCGI